MSTSASPSAAPQLSTQSKFASDCFLSEPVLQTLADCRRRRHSIHSATAAAATIHSPPTPFVRRRHRPLRRRHRPLPPPPPSSPSATTIHSSNSSSAAAASFSTGGGGLPSPFPDLGAPLSATNTSFPSLQRSLTSAAANKMKKALRLRSLASSKGGSPRSGGCGGAKSAPPRWPATVGELTRVQMRISEPAATSSRRPRARHIAQGRAARAAPADAVPDVVELSVAKNKFKAFDLGGHQIARLCSNSTALSFFPPLLLQLLCYLLMDL
nr:uncharacterized protein LOC4338291 [Oryza sativa Japonica Group]